MISGIALGAALCLPAAAGGELFVKLPPGSGAAARDHGDQIEILSWSWSDSSAAQHRVGGSNQMSMDDTAGKEKLQRGSAGGDPDRPIIAGSVPNPPAARGANETIAIAGGRTETASGQATGKRQHMPLRARVHYDQPLGKGSVWIRVATPWAACRPAAQYPSLELATGARRYVLQDVTVASCGGSAGTTSEEVAFTYNKLAN